MFWALAGNADYLVTGDRRAGLLQRGHIERTRIATASATDLELWGDRVLDAASLEDVLGA